MFSRRSVGDPGRARPRADASRCVFFFQAEDGIRDVAVTGVQTCALPIFRPVVQDYLLPTAAFIVGPAELSYIAQSEVVYEHLLGRMPVMLPRAGFTLMDAKANKLLGKYGLTVAEVWAGSQELRRKMEAASVPKSLSKGFDRDQKQIAKMVEQLGKQIAKLDSTLAGTVERTKKGIEFHLEQLRQKAGRALDQRLGVLASHEQHLESLLNPHKGLQERELCLLPFVRIQ